MAAKMATTFSQVTTVFSQLRAKKGVIYQIIDFWDKQFIFVHQICVSLGCIKILMADLL